MGTLKITSEYAGLEFVVETYDAGSCSATFKFFKQPGQEFFEGSQVTNGEHMFKTDMHLENLTSASPTQASFVFGPRNRTLASNPVVSSIPFDERHHARVDPRRRLVGDQPLQQVRRGEGRGDVALVHLEEAPIRR